MQTKHSHPEAEAEAIVGPAFSPERAFAAYAVTGVFQGTFYANDEDPFGTLDSLASAVRPEVVAKTAVHCRSLGRMKEAAFLVAWLAAHDVELMLHVFHRVIDDARMLRLFVAIVRSGVTGRKSFGSAPKRALREWFAIRTPETIFRQSIGQSPSMSDVIKMVRPPPRNDKGEADAVREALYGYLIGKSVDCSKLPPLARAFQAWRASDTQPLPDVPFEMLTTQLVLRVQHWTELAKKMTFNQLRQNLMTLYRHGIFANPAMVDLVAERLADGDAVRCSRVQPYEVLVTYRAVAHQLPSAIASALARAIEHAVANVPEIPGSVVLCPDVSGSMRSPIDRRRSHASTVRCIDVAALTSAVILRKNDHALVLPFSDDVVAPAVNARDSVIGNVETLTGLPSAGTSCVAPLRWLDARGMAPDLVVFVSDNQSWTELHAKPGMDEEWGRLRARNPRAKLALIDLHPHSEMTGRADVLNVGGFSDAVFDVLASFARGDETELLSRIDTVIL